MGFIQVLSSLTFFHILELSKRRTLPLDFRRCLPWVVWRIWKNRNLLALEGRRFRPVDTIQKTREESVYWFLAQIVEDESRRNQNEEKVSLLPKWKLPRLYG